MRQTSDIDRPIFVCGTGRCGTSLLQLFLGHHPRIFSLRYEGRFLVQEDGILDLLANFSPAKLERFVGKMRGEWFTNVNRQGTPEEYVGGLHRDIDEQLLRRMLDEFRIRVLGSDEENREKCCVELVQSFYREPLRRSGKSRWLEKTPSNLVHMPELKKLFPKAVFLHIIRDGRDVAASIVERGFWPIGKAQQRRIGLRLGEKSVRNTATYWQGVLKHSQAIARRLPRKSYLELRYEDLVGDLIRLKEAGRFIRDSRCPTVSNLFSFIGAEPHDQMLNAIRPYSNSLARFQSDLSVEEIRQFEDIAKETLSRYRYELHSNKGQSRGNLRPVEGAE